jgi:hypothetical protein
LVNLKQGTSTTKIFEITNIGTTELSFNLSIEGLEKYIDLSETSFNLSAGATKRITVDFKVGFDTIPGEYYGILVVDSFKQARLPLLINVNEINLEFEVLVSVLEESKSIKPGKKVFANIELKSLKDQFPMDVLLYYAVKDFQGNIYDFFEENITFESNLILERFLNTSEEMPLGNYIFYARVYNEKDSSIHSDDFQVGYSFKFAAFVRTSSIFILVFFFSFVLFFFVVRYRRQKDKGRVLNLYVKLNELKGLVKEGKFDDAAKVYVGIKRIYGEHVPGDLLENKQKLAESIKLLASKINFDEVEEVVDEVKEKPEGEGSLPVEKKEIIVEKKEGNEEKILPVKTAISKPVLKKVPEVPIKKNSIVKPIVNKVAVKKDLVSKPLVKSVLKPLVKQPVVSKINSVKPTLIKKEVIKNEK